MKSQIKIFLLVVFLTTGFRSISQTENGFIPYSNPLLLNPSFAGFNKNTSIWSNLQFFSSSNQNTNHLFSISYDNWSERFNAGTAWYFYHGLTGELNTNHTGAGFSFSKPVPLNDGVLIPSLNMNYFFYTKQWFVYLIDGVLDKNIDPYQRPGVNFMRYNILLPRVGLLWNSPIWDIGVSASWRFRHHIGLMQPLHEPDPYHVILHASYKKSNKRKGLQAKPYKAIPELVILLSGDWFLSRAGFRLDQETYSAALFLQNNYSENMHGVAGLIGWKIENININLAAGGAYSLETKKSAMFGEISLGFVFPYNRINDSNPWAPPAKIF